MFTRTHNSITSFALGVVLGLAMCAAANASPPSPAFSFYLTYLQQTASADDISDIDEYMPDWWNARQNSANAKDKAATVERVRNSSRSLTQVTLEREEPVDDGVRLYMTARTKDLPMRGTVLLIKQAGAFKVEESQWRSVEPIVN